MKKKIMMGLGTLTAVAAPVVGLISCGDDSNIADKAIAFFPSKITIPHADSNNTNVVKLKTLAVGYVLENKNNSDIISYFGDKLDITKIFKAIKNDSDKDLKEFIAGQGDKTNTVSEIKVKKAFADNKMTLTLKVTAADLKPKIKDRGTASKDIEITFATA